MSLEPFWRLVAADPGLRLPYKHLQELVGGDGVAALLATGLVFRVPMEDGEDYPCTEGGEPGCCRHLVADGDGGLVAVCGASLGRLCPDEPVRAEEAQWLAVEPVSFGRAVCRLLGLSGGGLETTFSEGPQQLGVRRFGRTEVAFHLVSWPRLVLQGAHLEVLARRISGVVAPTVLLAPSSASLPPSVARGTPHGLEWLCLDQVLPLVGERVQVDLSPFLLRHRFPGVELGPALWPAFALVIDRENGKRFYAGQELGLARSPLAARFLDLMAAQPGVFIPRSELLVELWPDAFTTRGRALEDPDALDRRLRQLRGELGKVFRGLHRVQGLPHDPVENLRGRSDVEGGYRMNLRPHRVLVHR